MCSSGLCTSTPAGGAMSVAVTSPGPCLRRYMTTASSCSAETTSSLRFRMMSVTSSLTPATVENSCTTPAIRMRVTAAPGMDDRRVARLGPGEHERGHLQRRRPHLDDVALGHPVGGYVHLLAVDQEVPMRD